MLLRLIVILCLSANLIAASNFKLMKVDESYYLTTDGKEKIRISHSGIPKIISVKTHKDLNIIEYYSGSYGTSDVLDIHNRIVLYKGKRVLDAPFRYINKKEQAIWKIDHKNKTIEVTDPHGLNQKVKF